MSSHKKTDLICIIVIVLTVVLTVLFMNGKKLGITSVNTEDEDGGSGRFTAAELKKEIDETGAARISLDGENASVSGNGAYVTDGNVVIAYGGTYVLSGSLNGSVTVNTETKSKVYLIFDGAEIENDGGPALNIQKADKVFVNLKAGSENRLASGAQSAVETEDGALYSRDDLAITGTGTLTVNSSYKHGVVCNDTLTVTGGEITVEAPEDGLHANDGVLFCNAALHITAGDDGITATNDARTGAVYIESGEILIESCYEGIEGNTVEIAGGNIEIMPEDDGVNAPGGGEALIDISGGEVKIINEKGRDADGLDSNGDIRISGGSLFISMNGAGINCALDYGSENGGSLLINGGTVAAFGSSQMAEEVSAGSSQGFLMRSQMGEAGSLVTLTDADGKELLNETVPCGFTLMTLSAPGMKKGDTVTLSVNGEAETITVNNATELSAQTADGFGGNAPDGNETGFPDAQPGQPPEAGQAFVPDEEIRPMNNGEMPQRPNGEPPAMPGGEAPSAPDGEIPSKPDGEMPSKPDGEAPSMPAGEGSSPSAEGSSLPETETRTDGETVENSKADLRQRGNIPKPEQSETRSGSRPTPEQLLWLLISAAVLAIGIIIAKRK